MDILDVTCTTRGYTVLCFVSFLGQCKVTHGHSNVIPKSLAVRSSKTRSGLYLQMTPFQNGRGSNMHSTLV